MEVFIPDRENIIFFISYGKGVEVFTAEGGSAEVFTPGVGVEVFTPDGKNMGVFMLSGKHMEVFTPSVWTISHHIRDYGGIHTRWRTMEVFIPDERVKRSSHQIGEHRGLHTS